MRPNEKRMLTPNEKIQYEIPRKVIELTEKVLRDYLDMDPPNEGLVYWGGQRSADTNRVTLVIAPFTDSNPGRISTSNKSNFEVVRALNKNHAVQIAQVHSHPPYCGVDHSDGDSQWAAFRTEGLLSIVVPEYCRDGLLPLTSCGVHRYSNHEFTRLSNAYISRHFKLTEDSGVKLVDLRHEEI